MGERSSYNQRLDLRGRWLLVYCLSVLAATIVSPSLSFGEETKKFSLSQKDSTVTFTIKAAAGTVAGSLDRFSGTVKQEKGNADRLEIALDGDLRSMRMTSNQLKNFPLGDLLGTGQFHFLGKTVSRFRDGYLKVKGTLKWHEKTNEVAFPIKVTRSGRDKLEIEGQTKNDGDQLLAELPILLLFQVQSVSGKARLVFLQ